MGEPEPAARPKRDWRLWACMGVIAVAVLAAGVVGLIKNSDAAKTSELREWLADVHRFDEQYEDLGTATYEDGDVRVEASHEWADPAYGGYFLCAWVEPWLRDLGHGGEDSQIIVQMGGREVLRSRGAAETCDEASYNTQYGG